mmetsp:Transcript_28077/g.66670  ORF Transcript_28077/g.66670 Transcript_28077/m.66670 type:complete len:255 (-) Transcript_28077:38-802(-)
MPQMHRILHFRRALLHCLHINQKLAHAMAKITFKFLQPFTCLSFGTKKSTGQTQINEVDVLCFEELRVGKVHLVRGLQKVITESPGKSFVALQLGHVWSHISDVVSEFCDDSGKLLPLEPLRQRREQQPALENGHELRGNLGKEALPGDFRLHGHLLRLLILQLFALESLLWRRRERRCGCCFGRLRKGCSCSFTSSRCCVSLLAARLNRYTGSRLLRQFLQFLLHAVLIFDHGLLVSHHFLFHSDNLLDPRIQ